MKRTIPLYLLLLLTGCTKTTKANDNTTPHAVSNIDPSEKIDFINYPIDDLEGITTTAHEGIYRNFDFEYRDGETMFILVPKIGAAKWYQQQVTKYQGQDADTMIDKDLNKQSFKTLSKEFDIWIFHTPKKFLKHTPNMDAPYTPQIPRKIFLYKYNEANNSWSTMDTFTINNDNDEVKSNEWRESTMNKLAVPDNENSGIPKFLQTKSSTNNLTLNKECDLNQDNIQDRILVFTPKDINDQHSFSTVYVLMGKKDDSFTEYSNDKIIDSNYQNSYAEGFRDVTIKNNYFTIEENIASQPIQNKYTTFVLDKKNNSVHLHKLGFSTIYPDAAKDKEVTYSSKDFGKITFESYDPSTMKY